jgi:hypothetical protein
MLTPNDVPLLLLLTQKASLLEVLPYNSYAHDVLLNTYDTFSLVLLHLLKNLDKGFYLISPFLRYKSHF